jgi:hypothetical protein
VPAKDKHSTLFRNLGYLDDEKTNKMPLVLQFFIGMSIKIESLKIIANGALGFIVDLLKIFGFIFGFP